MFIDSRCLFSNLLPTRYIPDMHPLHECLR